MKRLFAFLLSTAFLLGLVGCSGFRYLDSSSETELTEFQCLEKIRTSKLNPEEQRLQQIVRLSEEQLRLKEELSTVKQELRGQKELVAEHEVEPAPPAPEVTEVAAKAPAPVKVSRLKIKVLSGDGKISTAASMRARLQGMGYRVERIDLAPRATFKSDVVYYSRKYQEEARALAARLGRGAELKPLSWNTSFDIIVVSAH